MVKIKKNLVKKTNPDQNSEIKLDLNKCRNIKKRLRKIFVSKKNIFKYDYNNPSITKFNIDSQFYYDLNEVDKYLSKINNKNLLKVNENEFDCLNKKIEDIELLKESKNQTKFITIKKEIFEKIENYTKLKEIKDPLTEFIKKKFENKENRSLLSCRKLSELYTHETGQKTNRTTINKIIKKKLGFHYLKTTTKNPKINSINNTLISFAFIKIIVRCIFLGFKIIYLDESNITNKNSNYRCFRKKNEIINYKYDKLFKSNLLMAVDDKNVIYYEISDESTTEKTFINFIKNLIKTLKEKYEGKFIIVLDNLSSHKTPLVKQFFIENNINIVFNSPYHSEWNSIELAFRSLKRKYYQILFETKEEQVNYIKSFLENKDFSKTIEFNFCETLKSYKKFILDNRDINLKRYV